MKPPKSNLSPLAEPWGRYVEGEISDLNTFIERSSGGFRADQSFQDSTLDNLASQIRELEERALQAVSAPDMMTAIYDAGNASVSTTMSLPAPTHSRMAVISASCAPRGMTPRNSVIFIRMSVDGKDFHRSSFAVPLITSSTPPGWDSFTAEGYIALPVSAGSSPQVTIQAIGIGNTYDPGTKQALITSIGSSITYAQRTS